uniref:Uncharacterized protein n=1 Tax=Moniliophthora roreri TaxID=221103 RepID=A0A0W0G2Z2_MONRR
MANFTPRYHC